MEMITDTPANPNWEPSPIQDFASEDAQVEAGPKSQHPSAYFRSFAGKPLIRGNGWHVDPLSFQPVITNETGFRQDYAGDPARDAVQALWSGEAKKALDLISELLTAEGCSLRYRALEADALRDLGEFEKAIAKYQKILERARGGSLEAEYWMRLGVVYFKGTFFAEAQNAFAKAYEKRVLEGAGIEEIETAMRCLIRTQELLKEQHEQGSKQ